MLSAAKEAFCRFGYQAVTMRQIAEAAQVSTRTLYNHYTDKFSLFEACLESGSSAFPTLDGDSAADAAPALREFAIALVRMLSGETSQRLGMLVYREGAEFPELIRASESNQQEYLVTPLASFLRVHDMVKGDEEAGAKILLSMMLSDWQRRLSFALPAPTDAELEKHASLAVALFLKGSRQI